MCLYPGAAPHFELNVINGSVSRGPRFEVARVESTRNESRQYLYAALDDAPWSPAADVRAERFRARAVRGQRLRGLPLRQLRGLPPSRVSRITGVLDLRKTTKTIKHKQT